MNQIRIISEKEFNLSKPRKSQRGRFGDSLTNKPTSKSIDHQKGDSNSTTDEIVKEIYKNMKKLISIRNLDIQPESGTPLNPFKHSDLIQEGYYENLSSIEKQLRERGGSPSPK